MIGCQNDWLVISPSLNRSRAVACVCVRAWSGILASSGLGKKGWWCFCFYCIIQRLRALFLFFSFECLCLYSKHPQPPISSIPSSCQQTAPPPLCFHQDTWYQKPSIIIIVAFSYSSLPYFESLSSHHINSRLNHRLKLLDQ